MIRTGVITDELWELVEPALPSGVGRQGRPWRDHRQVLEAIAWRFRTGCPWRGSAGRIWAVADAMEAASSLVNGWNVSTALRARAGVARPRGQAGLAAAVDSTIVRAHQRAAGAPRASLSGGSAE